MVTKNNYVIVMTAITLLAFCTFLTGCSTFSSQSTELVEITNIPPMERTTGETEEIKGTATALWERPLVDMVVVPPGLNPEGTVYIPAHETIVEIRQGRWEYYNRSKGAAN